MMKKKKKLKNYQAIGFIELIISIAVAGIAIMVLMNMSANSMKEAIRYERHDALTRLAMDGALVVRRHAEDANDRRRDISFSGEEYRCYEIDFDEGVRRVIFTPSYSPDNLELRSALYTDIIYNEENNLGDLYYVAYCVDRIETSVESMETYIGRIVTGYVECSGCAIEPYSHTIIINIK